MSTRNNQYTESINTRNRKCAESMSTWNNEYYDMRGMAQYVLMIMNLNYHTKNFHWNILTVMNLPKCT